MIFKVWCSHLLGFGLCVSESMLKFLDAPIGPRLLLAEPVNHVVDDDSMIPYGDK